MNYYNIYSNSTIDIDKMQRYLTRAHLMQVPDKIPFGIEDSYKSIQWVEKNGDVWEWDCRYSTPKDTRFYMPGYTVSVSHTVNNIEEALDWIQNNNNSASVTKFLFPNLPTTVYPDLPIDSHILARDLTIHWFDKNIVTVSLCIYPTFWVIDTIFRSYFATEMKQMIRSRKLTPKHLTEFDKACASTLIVIDSVPFGPKSIRDMEKVLGPTDEFNSHVSPFIQAHLLSHKV